MTAFVYLCFLIATTYIYFSAALYSTFHSRQKRKKTKTVSVERIKMISIYNLIT